MTAIHAWVEVLPQPQIADGPLAGIPFGAKDIMETRALVTEYGSPIYKGRHGTEDAAMIRRLGELGRDPVGQDPHCAIRASDSRAHAQSAQSGAHAGWQFERLGRGRGGGHGAVRDGHANGGVDFAAGVLLRRDWIQADVWNIAA